MSVYVDRIRTYPGIRGYAKRYGEHWSHLIADTDEELHALAEKIGLQRKWAQYPGTSKSHYDCIPSKRALAIKHGAIEVTDREFVDIRRRIIASQVRVTDSTLVNCQVCQAISVELIWVFGDPHRFTVTWQTYSQVSGPQNAKSTE